MRALRASTDTYSELLQLTAGGIQWTAATPPLTVAVVPVNTPPLRRDRTNLEILSGQNPRRLPADKEFFFDRRRRTLFWVVELGPTVSCRLSHRTSSARRTGHDKMATPTPTLAEKLDKIKSPGLQSQQRVRPAEL